MPLLWKSVKQNETTMIYPLQNKPGYRYGYVCNHSKLKFIPTFKCIDKMSLVKRTTLNPITIPTPGTTPTPPGGCFYKGQFHNPGTVLEQGRCYTVLCASNGKIMVADDFDCDKVPPSLSLRSTIPLEPVG